MGNLVVGHEISGGAVYGVQQMQYTVDGMSDQDFATALTVAAFRQTSAIEDAAASYTTVVRQRQRKVDDLGGALAVLAMATATLPTGDKPKSSDKSAANDALKTAAATVSSYGLSMPLTDGNKITRGNAMTSQNDIQYALDMEDNNLQQDMVSLQSLLTKRDNSFSNAAKIVKKALNASGTTIGNIE